MKKIILFFLLFIHSNSLNITKNEYGKNDIKLFYVNKNDARHEVIDLDISIRLKLNNPNEYTNGNNSYVISTDSQKNIIYALAKEYGIKNINEFGLRIINYFLSEFNFIEYVKLTINEISWKHLSNSTHKHNHVFIKNQNYNKQITFFKNIHDEYPEISVSIKNLNFLKTTQSGFYDFYKDRYILLQDTNDRILSTKINSFWNYKKNNISDLNIDKIVDELLYNIAGNFETGIYSKSLQNTAYDCLQNILNDNNDIEKIKVMLPNLHYIPFEFVNISTSNNVYIVTDKPSGVVILELTNDN